MAWSESTPRSTTKINEVPSIMQDNLDAIEDLFGVAHSTMTCATSGMHNLGISGFTYDGTTAGLTALSGMGSGSVAFNTTIGAYELYTGSSWAIMGASQWSRVRAYSSSSQALGSSPTTIVFGKETYDTLSEFEASTGIFTALASGAYLVGYNITIATTGVNTRALIAEIQKNSSSYAYTYFPVNALAGTDSWQTVNGVCIVLLNEGDTILVKAATDSSQTNVTYPNTAYTYIFIHRLGGQGF